MSTRRKKKIKRSLQGFFYIVIIGLTGFFFWSAFTDISNYFQLTMQIQANTALQEETAAQKEELEQTKKNLTNPDYLEFVARGKYHVSKSGEQVFVFPTLDDEQ